MDRTCDICTDVKRKFRSGGCAHLICVTCWKRWRQACASSHQPWSCPVCRRLFSPPLPLPRAINRERVMDPEVARWIEIHTKPCPRCWVPIEKDGGCCSLRCSHCLGDFCWISGTVAHNHSLIAQLLGEDHFGSNIPPQIQNLIFFLFLIVLLFVLLQMDKDCRPLCFFPLLLLFSLFFWPTIGMITLRDLGVRLYWCCRSFQHRVKND